MAVLAAAGGDSKHLLFKIPLLFLMDAQVCTGFPAVSVLDIPPAAPTEFQLVPWAGCGPEGQLYGRHQALEPHGSLQRDPQHAVLLSLLTPGLTLSPLAFPASRSCRPAPPWRRR